MTPRKPPFVTAHLTTGWQQLTADGATLDVTTGNCAALISIQFASGDRT